MLYKCKPDLIKLPGTGATDRLLEAAEDAAPENGPEEAPAPAPVTSTQPPDGPVIVDAEAPDGGAPTDGEEDGGEGTTAADGYDSSATGIREALTREFETWRRDDADRGEYFREFGMSETARTQESAGVEASARETVARASQTSTMNRGMQTDVADRGTFSREFGATETWQRDVADRGGYSREFGLSKTSQTESSAGGEALARETRAPDSATSTINRGIQTDVADRDGGTYSREFGMTETLQTQTMTRSSAGGGGDAGASASPASTINRGMQTDVADGGAFARWFGMMETLQTQTTTDGGASARQAGAPASATSTLNRGIQPGPMVAGGLDAAGGALGSAFVRSTLVKNLYSSQQADSTLMDGSVLRCVLYY